MAQAWKVTVTMSSGKFAKGLSVQVVTAGAFTRPSHKEIYEAFEKQLGIKRKFTDGPHFDIQKA